jgi:hypothetical protein
MQECREQGRDSTRRREGSGFDGRHLRVVDTPISFSAELASDPPAHDSSRSVVVNGRLGRLVANVTRPHRGYAVAQICVIDHCIEYVSTKSRLFIAAVGLDALPLLRFRRCWNYAIASAALLAMSCSFANAERFSIKCTEAGYFYVSFDTESAKVVEETLSGFALKGRIDKIDGERIDFHVAIPGRPDMDLVWDGSKKTLTVLAIPGDKYRTGNVFECVGTELRPMLSKYDSMPP